MLLAFRFAGAALVALASAPAAVAAAQGPTRIDVMVPMRDGVKLSAEVWLPAATGQYPVLLARTPYGKTGLHLGEWAAYFAERGYAVAIQDTRGRGASAGTFDFFFPEGRDGFDTIEWLASQPWSNGRTGTFGLSYLGTAQWLAAREHPPHLTCMAPTAAGGRWFEEIPYMGGALLQAWLLDFASSMSPGIDPDSVNWGKVLAHRPMLTADSVMGKTLPLYRDVLTHSTFGPYWNRLRFDANDFAAIDIPTLTTTGWFDGDQPGALFYWRGVMAHATSRKRHFLIVGPWRHPETFRGGSTKVGDSEFTAESVVDTKAMHLEFFDWCLKQRTATFAAPRARVYVTGANVWRSLDAYPPPNAASRRLFLDSRGQANSNAGDGRLSWTRPRRSVVDTFTFDPRKPLAEDFENWGLDRTPTQRHADVLVYTSEVLRKPLEVIGSVVVNLVAASDSYDTDFTAVLSDVPPDGRALKLGPLVGIRRGRYRDGYEREKLLTPGKPETFRIELFDIAHRFGTGHRLRLEISSSAAPIYAPNQNTGNPVATDTVWKVARQTIHHDRSHASFVELPVVRP